MLKSHKKEKITITSKHYIASCNYCQHAFDEQPLCMIKHLLYCNSTPNELKNKTKRKDFDNIHGKNKQKSWKGS